MERYKSGGSPVSREATPPSTISSTVGSTVGSVDETVQRHNVEELLDLDGDEPMDLTNSSVTPTLETGSISDALKAQWGSHKKLVGIRFLFPPLEEAMNLLERAKIWVARHDYKYFVDWTETELETVDPVLRPLSVISKEVYKLHMNRSEYCRNVKLKYCLQSQADWSEEFRQKLSKSSAEGGFTGLCQAKIAAAELWRRYSENYRSHQARRFGATSKALQLSATARTERTDGETRPLSTTPPDSCRCTLTPDLCRCNSCDGSACDDDLENAQGRMSSESRDAMKESCFNDYSEEELSENSPTLCDKFSNSPLVFDDDRDDDDDDDEIQKKKRRKRKYQQIREGEIITFPKQELLSAQDNSPTGHRKESSFIAKAATGHETNGLNLSNKFNESEYFSNADKRGTLQSVGSSSSGKSPNKPPMCNSSLSLSHSSASSYPAVSLKSEPTTDTISSSPSWGLNSSAFNHMLFGMPLAAYYANPMAYLLNSTAAASLRQVYESYATNMTSPMTSPMTPTVSPPVKESSVTPSRHRKSSKHRSHSSSNGSNCNGTEAASEYRRSERGLSFLFPSFSDHSMSLMDKVRITILRHKNNYFLNWDDAALSRLDPLVRPKMLVTSEIYKEYCHRNAMKYDSNLQFAMESEAPWADDFRKKLTLQPADGGFSSLCEVKLEAGRLWREYSGKYRMHNIVKWQMDMNNSEAKPMSVGEDVMTSHAVLGDEPSPLHRKYSRRRVRNGLHRDYMVDANCNHLFTPPNILAYPSPSLSSSSSSFPSLHMASNFGLRADAKLSPSRFKALSPDSDGYGREVCEGIDLRSSRSFVDNGTDLSPGFHRSLPRAVKSEAIQVHQSPSVKVTENNNFNKSPSKFSFDFSKSHLPSYGSCAESKASPGSVSCDPLFPQLNGHLSVAKQLDIWLQRHRNGYFLGYPAERLEEIDPVVRPNRVVTLDVFHQHISASLVSALEKISKMMEDDKQESSKHEADHLERGFRSESRTLSQVTVLKEELLEAEEWAREFHAKLKKSVGEGGFMSLEDVLSEVVTMPQTLTNGKAGNDGASNYSKVVRKEDKTYDSTNCSVVKMDTLNSTTDRRHLSKTSSDKSLDECNKTLSESEGVPLERISPLSMASSAKMSPLNGSVKENHNSDIHTTAAVNSRSGKMASSISSAEDAHDKNGHTLMNSEFKGDDISQQIRKLNTNTVNDRSLTTESNSPVCSCQDEKFLWESREILQVLSTDKSKTGTEWDHRLEPYLPTLREALGADYHLPDTSSGCIVDLVLAFLHARLQTRKKV